MTMDRWLIHCSLLSIKNKWKGKALAVENSAVKEHVYRNKVYSVPPSGNDTGLYQWPGLYIS